MTVATLAAATLPPVGLPGLDPAWSRLVDAVDADGVVRTWHVLDNAAPDPTLTVLCVHGNPTWGYLWRSLLTAAPPNVRVVAVDHLDMGFSDRTGTVRRLARRIEDLGAVTTALGVTGPVVTVAHDWGGPISLGWALDHPEQLAGVVLTNTAVHQPEGASAPRLIRLARTPGVLPTVTTRTTTFLRGAAALTGAPLSRQVKDAYLAPYRTSGRRRAIEDFVADIPLRPDHPSAATLDGIAAGLDRLGDVPVLLVWGPQDPVFSDLYLTDLLGRLPQADVHRFEGGSHLVIEEPDAPATVLDWIGGLGAPREPAPAGRPTEPNRRPAWAALDELAGDPRPALVELGGARRSVSFAALARRVRDVGAGLPAVGVRPGDRVALLVPPGADLAVALYACWRIGAVPVVADAGLGLRGIGRALRSAGPAHLIGVPRALAAARALGWPGRAIVVGPSTEATRRAVGAELSLAEVARAGSQLRLPPEPGPHDEALVAFTSGATGPAKGVAYRHGQLEAQRDVLATTYGLTSADRMVAGFAPFALYGPALGITSAVPGTDVTRPGTLTAEALARAVGAVDATVVFASPAALRNVVATAGRLSAEERAALAGVRTLLSFGAPVPADLLRSCVALLPAAEAHTPYGMTEVLPVTDITLPEIEKAGEGEGVCVGQPVPGVEVQVSPFDGPSGAGEILVRAEHVKDGYDRLWRTEQRSRASGGWHRTGDVGHLDDDGRLWVEGRLGHVAWTATGPVTPVGPEQRIERLPEVRAAAVVGIGPKGTQQLVAVVVPEQGRATWGPAEETLTTQVRAAQPGLAAVLSTPRLPLDRRHNSKVDRSAVAAWADRVLSGRPTWRGARSW